MSESMEQPVESHGDVTGEYLALRSAAGQISGLHRMVTASGPDSTRFLNDILSQDVAGMTPGEVRRSLLLAPQGKLRAVLWVLRGEDRIGLVTDSARTELVLEELSTYLIRVKVELGLEQRPVIEVIGPDAPMVLDAAGLPVPSGLAEVGEVVVAAAPLGPFPRFLLVGADGAALSRAGARPVGALAHRAVRVEAGEPVMGIDIDERTIPQESGLVEAAVSLTKGCFVGQELVARIDSRGHVNRHLRGVRILTNLLPPQGAEIVAGDRTTGSITSVAESLELRAPVGLALLRREVAPGDQLLVRWDGGTAPAVAEQLPMAGPQSTSAV